MYPTITDVKHIEDYRLHLTFATGESGIVDLAGDIIGSGGVFKPLQEIKYFVQVRVDPFSGTIVWPNGVDLDPITLYKRVTFPYEQ
jgi:hypothetical protein